MTPHKGKATRIVFLSIPPLFLAAYLAGVPVPLPAFLSPARTYLLAPRSGAPASLADIKLPGLNLFAVLSDRVVPLRRGAPGLEEVRAESLPARPAVETALRDAEASPKVFGRIRLVCGVHPSEEEVARIREFQERTGRSVSLLVLPDDRPLLRASSYASASGSSGLKISMTTGPGAREFDLLSAVQDSAALGTWQVPRIPPEGLRFPTAGTGGPVSLVFSGSGGTRREEILLAEPDPGFPRVLVVSRRTGSSGFLDSAYSVRRILPEDLETADLTAYPLVAFDGVPLREIPPGISRTLRSLVERKAVSLLFAVDSPDFGRSGDNPELEALLPVDLLPRSLKRLPDLAVLLLLDVSGSMFGDKLSLAKAAGVEFLKALKPTDRVGLLLFSEERSWLYRFEPNSSIQPGRDIPNLAAGGGTDLAAALREGLGELSKFRDRDRHAVAISDGVTKPADFRPIEEAAARAGISLSTIAVGKDADVSLLGRLAKNTGGRAYRADRFDQIPALLFEDRKSVSRTSFSRETQSVLALNGDKVSTVEGMALLTPRDPSTVLLANELGDPLLASREYRNRGVVVFASDLYGAYTSDFFRSPGAVSYLKRRLDALLAEESVPVSVHEHAGGVELVLRSPWLVSPEVRVLYADRRVAREGPLRRTAPGVFGAALPLSERGLYTAVLSDRGAAFARVPVAVNGVFRAIPASAYRAVREYRPARLVRYPGRGAWLVAFFLSSLGVTVLLRLDGSGARTAAVLIAALTVSARLGAEPEIRIDEAGYRPYGICSGTVRSPEGFSGTLELRGRRFDGRDVALFRAEIPGWTASLEFRFIPDENVREVYVAGLGGERGLPLPPGGTEEAAGRRFLASLSPPFRSRPPARLPGSARLRARDPGEAGSEAARLFGVPPEPAAAGILAAFAAGALALAAFRGRMGRAYLPALLVLAAAGAAGMAAARPSAFLFRFPLPGPRGPYDLEVRTGIERSPGLAVVRFDRSGNGPTRPSLTVLGIRTPPGRSVPLSAFPEGALVRFRDPPLILGDGNGSFSLRFEGFALGWELLE